MHICGLLEVILQGSGSAPPVPPCTKAELAVLLLGCCPPTASSTSPDVLACLLRADLEVLLLGRELVRDCIESVVPTCFKETIIVPVPKKTKTKILCLNDIVKFADDTTVIGLIAGDYETAYREEVRALTSWCQDNNLHLNIGKTKELIVDFRDFRRRQRGTRPPLHQRDYGGESQQLQPDSGSSSSAGCGGSTWTQGYSAASTGAPIESILTGCITAWYSSCTALNRKALQRVVKAAQHITRTELPSMEDLYTQRCRKKATKIIKDPSHTQLQTVLPAAVWLVPTVLQHSSPNHQAQGQLHTAAEKSNGRLEETEKPSS
ncbi:hypothetical protein L3Q82_017989 [Scortum barcoo]|uniref:Uncharacterized protein n=1 Tax=Scortum barcoo TaxID=214431 RepID=A0ACB8VIA8_9TELE|nr:hypothetical protein L3Q82_017989 [Scortum barcoo]